MTSSQSRAGSLLALGLASVAHLLLYFIPVTGPVWVPAAREIPPIELDPGPVSEDTKDKPIIHSSKLIEEDPAAKDAKAQYGAEFRNRTAHESQAPLKGRFHQGGSLLTPDPNGEVGGQLNMSDLMPYSSSPNEIAGDIPLGSETVLNTDRVLYASFINRIADEIYDPWVRFAQEAVGGATIDGKLESRTYITKLQITFDRHGEILAIQTVKSCGIDSLDQAPKRAFWDVEPFPNPPEQMFEKNDSVSVAYEFHFELRNSAFNILPFKI